MSSQLLHLNAFRGEPASSGFEWHFTPNHNSFADSSTTVGSDLHLVSPNRFGPPLSFTQVGSISSDNCPMKTRFRCGSGGFP
ncbi:hypothetical protein E1A91_D12G081400v1 [Gossypium mustelinum]|uniref:Uncharacterized protein n=1 Tax=Gossypium mustelinum TaxID=34275 RepID=A0A5D2SAS1_GOSMU|nr:hypothetical protein E1A91_D12G081400v1 [Gossypium mustelinum]